MDIKISVVVPTYRRPTLLNQCIKALLHQSFTPEAFEIIIVSDGPDTDTQHAVSLWAGKGSSSLHYLALSEKKGPAAARNAGWRMSDGEIVAFTDDDCIPDPHWLQAIWNAYQQTGATAITGRIIVPVSDSPTDFERNTQGLEKAAFVTANCAIEKTVLERVQGFDEAFRMAWREDSDLEFKLLQHHVPLHHVADAVITHPVRKASWGVSMKEQKKGMFNALLYKKYPELYRKKIQAHPAWNYYVMILLFVGMIIALLSDAGWMSLFAFIGWATLMIAFIRKRLSNTSRSLKHVIEMIITSLAIPFLSVYWQLYGAFKYRVLFF